MNWYEGPELSILRRGEFCAEVSLYFSDTENIYGYAWVTYRGDTAMEWQWARDRADAKRAAEASINKLIGENSNE